MDCASEQPPHFEAVFCCTLPLPASSRAFSALILQDITGIPLYSSGILEMTSEECVVFSTNKRCETHKAGDQHEVW